MCSPVLVVITTKRREPTTSGILSGSYKSSTVSLNTRLCCTKGCFLVNKPWLDKGKSWFIVAYFMEHQILLYTVNGFMKNFTHEIFNLPFSLQIVHYGPQGSYGRITETPDLLSHTVHEGVFLNSRHLRKKLGALFIHLHFDKLITNHMKDLIFFLMLAWEHLLHQVWHYVLHAFFYNDLWWMIIVNVGVKFNFCFSERKCL